MWLVSRRRRVANGFWAVKVSEVGKRENVIYSCGYMIEQQTNPLARYIITAHSDSTRIQYVLLVIQKSSRTFIKGFIIQLV